MVDEVLPGLAQIDALRTQLVAVEDDLGLRLVELQVGVGENEQTAGERLLHQLSGELDELLRLGRPTRSRGRLGSLRRLAAVAASTGIDADARESSTSGAVDFHQELLRGLAPLTPWLGHHAAETAGRAGDLEDAGVSGNER